MRINVAQQLKETIGSVRHYRIDESDREGFSVQGEVQLMRTNRSILVNGVLNAVNKAICSRCADEFNIDVILNIEEEYLLPRTVSSDNDSDMYCETGGLIVDENSMLDLGEAIRQYMVMTMPMKPICQDSCAGLCTSCGCNLNLTRCNCSTINPDSPWAPLQALLQRE